MRREAEKRIGSLYPKVTITAEMAANRTDLKMLVGQSFTVIAWIWARTVKSPNPAFSHVEVPLVSSFVLSSKTGKEAYVNPIIVDDTYTFEVLLGKVPASAVSGTKLTRGAHFQCILSKSAIASSHIYQEAQAQRMGTRLMAMVLDGPSGKLYLSPDQGQEDAAKTVTADWKPDLLMPANPRWFSPPMYGLKGFGDLFTSRQLVALCTYSDLAQEAMKMCEADQLASGQAADSRTLEEGGSGTRAYAQAVQIYLAFSVDRLADYHTAFGRWQHANQQLSNMFGRQAIPMVWDFPEANPIGSTGGSFANLFDWTVQSLSSLGYWSAGAATQADAARSLESTNRIVSTDPPYYDNIGYADLSDFFYVWMRRSLRSVFPSLFVTVARDGITIRPLLEQRLTLKTYLACRADNESKPVSEMVRGFGRKLRALQGSS